MDLNGLSEPLHATGCNLSGTVVTKGRIDDANLTGAAIANADLSGMTLTNCQLTGMRIDGILVMDMLDAYRKAH